MQFAYFHPDLSDKRGRNYAVATTNHNSIKFCILLAMLLKPLQCDPRCMDVSNRFWGHIPFKKVFYIGTGDNISLAQKCCFMVSTKFSSKYFRFLLPPKGHGFAKVAIRSWAKFSLYKSLLAFGLRNGLQKRTKPKSFQARRRKVQTKTIQEKHFDKIHKNPTRAAC